MPKITDIKEQKRKDRFNIYLEGKFAFALSAEVLAKADLSVGQEISEQKIEKLRNKDIEDKLYNRVLKFLSYRPRSEREARNYLAGKIRANQSQIRENQGESKMVECLMTKLKSLKLIDDREFTRWWVEQRQIFRPKGIYALKQELKQKGISEEIMAKWLNGYMAKVTELEGARKVVHKNFRRLKRPTSREVRMKLYAFLQRRGFSYDTIKLVLDEVLTKR